MNSEELFIDLSSYFRPHPVQDYILKSKAKWKLLECGRRFGKGRAAVFWLVTNYCELMSKPRPESLVPIVHINVFVPSIGSMSVPWLELKKFIPQELIISVNEAERTINLLGGGLVEVKSGDIRAIQQGVGLDILWITEADKIERSVWYDIIPMLRSQWRAGLAWIESKPYNETGWFHELYQKGLTPSKQLESFHFSTYANPFVDWDDLEFDKEVMGEIDYNREYLAIVEAGSQAAFPTWKNCIYDLTEFPVPPHFEHVYQIGVDLGKQQDYTAIAVFNLVTRKIDYLEKFRTTWGETRIRIAAVSRQYLTGGIPTPVWVDATGKGEPVVEELIRECPDISFHEVVLVSAIRFQALARLALAIEKKDIIYPDDISLKQQLSLMKRIAASPMDKFMMPLGKHDDIVFALALAYNKEHIDNGPLVSSISTLKAK